MIKKKYKPELYNYIMPYGRSEQEILRDKIHHNCREIELASFYQMRQDQRYNELKSKKVRKVFDNDKLVSLEKWRNNRMEFNIAIINRAFRELEILIPKYTDIRRGKPIRKRINGKNMRLGIYA